MIKANFSAYGKYVTDSLYQWDIDRILSVSGLNLEVAPEVHFSNASMDKAIVRQATLSSHIVSVPIPNSLLQDPLTIRAHIGIYEGDTFRVVEVVEIPVKAKARPSDYRIEDSDEEIYSFKALENAIANIVSTESDKAGAYEVADIRRAADGKIHASAGMAVRAQITALSEAIDILNRGGVNLKEDFIGERVNEWLDEHPEATTTVQDGALTLSKFSDELKPHILKDYVTPQMFGAKGDGVTDDTEALKKAVESGKSVYVPSGTYLLDALVIDRKCKIYGDPHNKPTLKCRGITLAELSCLFGLTIISNAYDGTGLLINASGCEISDCIIYSFNIGLELSPERHIIGGVFKNLTIGYNKHAGVKAVASGNAQKNHILFEHLYIVNNGINYADDAAESTKLVNGFGMYVSGGYAIEIRNCVYEYNSGVGLFLDQAYPLYGCKITSPYFEHNKYAQLYVNNVGGTYMKNVHISGDFYTDAGRALPADSLTNRELYIVNNTRLKNNVDDKGNYFSKVSDIANHCANRYCPFNLFPYDIIGEVTNPNLTLEKYNGEKVWKIASGSVRVYGCPIPIEKGNYTITFDVVKSGDANGSFIFAMVGHKDGSKSKSVVPSSEWENVSVSMSFTDYGTCDLYVENGTTQTFYIKNIRIVKV